jgi:hypothetical protein
MVSRPTFSVDDAETPAISLTMTPTSGNQALAPDGAMQPGGDRHGV